MESRMKKFFLFNERKKLDPDFYMFATFILNNTETHQVKILDPLTLKALARCLALSSSHCFSSPLSTWDNNPMTITRKKQSKDKQGVKEACSQEGGRGRQKDEVANFKLCPIMCVHFSSQSELIKKALQPYLTGKNILSSLKLILKIYYTITQYLTPVSSKIVLQFVIKRFFVISDFVVTRILELRKAIKP
uniref:Uncharacterized protein n=1 Tax=Strigamia maritima TaxID=126957 RepID=T1JN21_STRMM